MKTVNMHAAKSSLSRLVRDVSCGIEAEIIIAIDGKPAARIVPLEQQRARELGLDRGLVAVATDFDDVDAEIANLFEGRA